MKTNIRHTLHLCKSMLSALLIVSVFLTATHAKDVVATSPEKTKLRIVESQSTRSQDDPVQKSVGDLHNHTDKTMLKNFAKSMGDSTTLAAKRDEHDERSADDQPMSVRLFEAYLMMQLAFAYARA